ncbi:MAG: PorT family protein [Bacteroidota bacterium]|nr:PorT family protein [Bacteroidota bacterium]
MKKLILTLAIITATFTFASAQILPSFQLGIKGGINLASLDHSSSAFSTGNRAGYLGGLWARVGALGFNFQPELYVTAKNVTVTDGGTEVKAKFTSIDVPLLVGGKIGAFGLGARFYTGPLVSFAINKDQSFGSAAGKVTSLDYKDQNFAWVLGAGVDIRSISVDLRYEAGITKQTFGYSHTRVSLFNLSLAVPLLKL